MLELFYSLHLSLVPALSPHEHVYFQAIRALISGGAGSLSYTGIGYWVLVIYAWLGMHSTFGLLFFLPLLWKALPSCFYWSDVPVH